MGRETMAQGVRGADRDVEFLACRGDELLQGADGYGADRLGHTLGDFVRRAGTSPDVGEKQQRVLVNLPVAAQVFDHGLGNGDHTVFVILALAYP